MNKKYILFIDSGVGGLTTLAKTIQVHNANYLYFADNKFAPFGNKEKDFLQERLSEIVSKFSKEYNIEMVVLACNTATTSSIGYLRKKFPKIVFVGTEPAIKLAIDKHFTNPAIIATKQTICCLKARNSGNINLIKCENLASQIELFYYNPTIKSNFLLAKSLFKIKKLTQNNDCIVLGCTHYPLIKQKLLKLTSKQILDGNDGVARRILSLSPNTCKNSTLKIILSDRKIKLIQNYKKILNQILANQIKL